MQNNILKYFLVAISFLTISQKTISAPTNETKLDRIAESFSAKSGIRGNHDWYIRNDAVLDSTTIYTKGYSAPYYFINLKDNYGVNSYGSCGYVATGMILSYYDTYYDDNIIEERYDEITSLSKNEMDVHSNSPGIKVEPDGLCDSSIVNAETYKNNINNYKNQYFHFKLLSYRDSIVNERPSGIYTQDDSYGLYTNEHAKLLRKYLYDYRGYSEQDFVIDSISENPYDITRNKSEYYDRVRAWTINYVKQGVPVTIHISNYDHGFGHIVVAYDYDEVNDKLYCHWGWEEDKTHLALESTKYSPGYIEGATALICKKVHRCSNNYKYGNISHCPFESAIPNNLRVSNYYLDKTPTFSWDWNNVYFYKEKFLQSSYYFKFEIVKNINTNPEIKFSYITNWKSFELNSNALKVLYSKDNNNNYYVRVSYSTYEDYLLGDYHYYYMSANYPPMYDANNRYLTLSNPTKNSGKWYVTIKNNTGMDLQVTYNSKLCFLNDAKQWNNLSDLVTITIAPFSTARVGISTNLFAGSIAVSHNFNGKSSRYITSADNLKNGSLSTYRTTK